MAWDASPMDKEQTVAALTGLGQTRMAALIRVMDPLEIKAGSAEFEAGDQPQVMGVILRYLRWVHEG